MAVLNEGIEQRNTRQLAKRTGDGLHVIKTAPPKRCRRRRYKHHRIRTGQHTSIAIGRYDLGMQGGVVKQLRQIRSQASLARILVRFNDARQRMRIDGARQAAIERLGHRRGLPFDRTLGAQQVPIRSTAPGAAMARSMSASEARQSWQISAPERSQPAQRVGDNASSASFAARSATVAICPQTAGRHRLASGSKHPNGSS